MTPGPIVNGDRELEPKQRQFNAAMDRYEREGVYRAIGKLTSIANVSLQLYTLWRVWPVSIGLPMQGLALLVAWVAADFINGLVHLYMDGNDHYESAVGPLVAAFHLHHRTPLYRKRNLLLVYFDESGAKFWLVGYLLLAAISIRVLALPPVVSHVLVYVGILSSVAEVSHYACHVMDSRWVRFLRATGLLLSKQHHARHHRDDNVNYAFLNGLTDPLLNVIARRWSRGYKQTTDVHYAAYVGAGTANR